jgi:hypothetical protein
MGAKFSQKASIHKMERPNKTRMDINKALKERRL